MRIFVPSARQRWFLENGSQMVFGFGGAPDSQPAKGLEIHWVEVDKTGLVTPMDNLETRKTELMKWDTWNIGGIETNANKVRYPSGI